MGLNAMVQRMIREVPGIASAYAKTLINEALGLIYDEQMWSFQLQTGGWLTPGLLFNGTPGVSMGTITPVPYSPTIIGDAVASAAWQAYIASAGQPLFTTLQIRSPFYSLYSIVNADTTSNPPFTTLTLDRAWTEPANVGMQYMIYQAYFPAPVPDFKRFLSMFDATDNAPMNYWGKTQADLAQEDPQRTIFDLPHFVVPYQTDQRQGSATYGSMLFELWPHPLSILPYTFSFLRRGNFLILPSDAVPQPLTEEAVLWRAKSAAYMYKEAQKGEEVERGSGADFKFLSQAAEKQHERVMKPIKDRDRDLAELYWNKVRRDWYAGGEPYTTVTGGLNVGRL